MGGRRNRGVSLKAQRQNFLFTTVHLKFPLVPAGPFALTAPDRDYYIAYATKTRTGLASERTSHDRRTDSGGEKRYRPSSALLHQPGTARTGPLVLSHGKGIYVYDEQGREYNEGPGGSWCVALGFGEEALVDAAVAQMRRYKWF
jgi:hypothetical protein